MLLDRGTFALLYLPFVGRCKPARISGRYLGSLHAPRGRCFWNFALFAIDAVMFVTEFGARIVVVA